MPNRTLLIGLPGAGWEWLATHLEHGRTPFLAGMRDNGVRSECQGFPPYIPSLGWASVVTGARPWKHQVFSPYIPSQVPTLWDHVADAGLRSLSVGWPAALTASAGVSVPEEFFQDRSLPAAATIPATLAEELEDLLLDETKLDPAMMRWICPDLTPEAAVHDPKAGRLARSMAIHYSIHNTAASLLETEEWDFASVRFPFLDHFLPDFGSHQSAPETVPSMELERYQGISGRIAGWLDLLLSKLASIAGKDTTILLVSTGRSGITLVPGIVLGAGPGIRQGYSAPPVPMLDLVPTILHTLGLPTPSELRGGVASGWFDSPAPLSVRPSPEPPPADHAYPDLPPHLAWQLAVDLLECGAAASALPHFQKASRAMPESPVIAYWLARCCYRLGMSQEAAEASGVLHDAAPESESARFFLGILALEHGAPREALVHLEQVSLPLADTYRAGALLETGESFKALDLIEKQLATHPDPLAWFGLARCRQAFGLHGPAILAVREALRLDPHLTAGWDLLAESLRKSGGLEAEVQAAREIHQSLSAAFNGTPTIPGIPSHHVPAFSATAPVSSPPLYRATLESEFLRADALQGLRQTPDTASWRRRVWVASRPERIVGSAIWRQGSGLQPATVHLNFAPRLLASDDTAGLLEPLFAELDASGTQACEVLVNRRQPWEPWLKDHGFHWHGCEELWGNLDTGLGRNRLLRSKFDKSRRRDGWTVRSPLEEDWRSIQEWCVGNVYLTDDQLDAIRDRISHEASGVVVSEAGLEGVLLATRQGMLHVIEFLGGHPERKARWPLATWMLFEHLGNLKGDRPHGDTVAMTTSTARGPFARHLAARFGGSVVDAIHRFSRS